MKKTMLVVLSAFVLISAAASAQRSSTARNVPQPGVIPAAGVPGACSPCLWYSGDTDPSNNWDADFNGNSAWAGLQNQVWVPFIAAPDGNPLHKHVLISAVTFNEAATTPDTNPPTDFAGMTYAFRTRVSSGNGGTQGKHGGCYTTSVVYTGVSPIPGLYNEYSFTCVFNPLSLPKVAVGTILWVNVLPKFTVSTLAYLDEAIDIPGLNQFGWSDDYWNSFLNGPSFFLNYAPATNVDVHFGEFSVAIAGTYTL
jgi:hypothetical protein